MHFHTTGHSLLKIKVLEQRSWFYPSRTVCIMKTVEKRLSIKKRSLFQPSLQHFAWDIMHIKKKYIYSKYFLLLYNKLYLGYILFFWIFYFILFFLPMFCTSQCSACRTSPNIHVLVDLQVYLVYGVIPNEVFYSSNTLNHQGESGIHS